MTRVGPTLLWKTVPGASSSSGSQSECSSSSQLLPKYQSWITRLEVNHKNMYANQITVQQAISKLLPSLRFAHVIPLKDLITPCPSSNLPPPQAGDDAADDDDKATDLGD
ncbi:hypothetical protein TIFTF001_034720 [Ficus carica]|uniref:Uncharacterized protein n=1 Tax=Ficus carica TaxID=3494 RepID=A0AA88E0X4_FICCA|nr:hypothetical protein TIFTF001_034720 [Ficus carica]